MKRLTVCMLVAAGLVLAGCEKKTTTKSRYNDQTDKSYYQDNQPGENLNLGNAPSRVESATDFYKANAGKSFYSMLSGSQEVPAVTTNATGTALFQITSDGSKLNYRVTVNALTDVTGGHIHWGQSGKNGAPVVMLPVTNKKGPFTGLLAEGTITSSDLTGPLSGKNLSALIDGFNNGSAYINIHTTANPDGEIRGQIVAGQPGQTAGMP